MLNSNESLSEKFIRRWFWIILFTFLIGPLGYIIRITLTGDLLKEEVGIIYGTIWLLWLLATYTDFWMTESLNYFLPKYLTQNDYIKSKTLILLTFFVQLFTSTLVSLWLYFWAWWLSESYFHNPLAKGVIEILSLYFIWNHLLQVNSTLFNATQNAKFMKWTDFFRVFMTTIGVLLLLITHKGNIITYTWAWIIWIYIGVIFSWILLYFYYYKPYFTDVKTHFTKILVKKFILYSLWTLFSANVASVLQLLDIQFIIYFLSTSEVADYTTYLSLIAIPYIFLSPIIGFLFPVISEIYEKKEFDKIRTIHSLFSSYFSVLILWVSVWFIILWIPITVLLFWPDYRNSGIALMYISPFLIINILIQINLQIIAGIWLIRERIYILLSTLILNIVLMSVFILGYKYNFLPFPNGSSAAAVAVGMSWILMWYKSRKVIYPYIWKFQFSIFLPNLISGIVVIILYYYFHFSSLIPRFGFSGRFEYLTTILFAFFFCMAIFLMINYSKMKDFIWVIRSVRQKK